MAIIFQGVTSSDLNKRAGESFSFGPTSFSRSLEATLEAETLEGGGTNRQVLQKVSLTFERSEAVSGNPPDLSTQDDPPAIVPFKQYRITIEEVQP